MVVVSKNEIFPRLRNH